MAEAYEVARAADDKFAAYPRRFSYLIDPDGAVFRSYDVTDVAEHAAEVISDVEAEIARRAERSDGGSDT